MKFTPARGMRLAAVAGLVLLAACGLPRSGPNKGEIFAGAVENDGNAFVVTVDERVTRATTATPALGFSSDFIKAGQIGSDTIAAGDVLTLTIWENVDTGLLAKAGAGVTALNGVQVDGNGNIFVPYAGKVHAAGNSPDSLRQIITEKLATQTPDPQVLVTRAAGDGTTVAVSGAVGQGVFPIERGTRTLSAMIARAGGITISPEVAMITVIRGNRSQTIWYRDLFTNPRYDIALRGGDRILVEEDRRAFTALGATGGQTSVRFDTQELSALEALARVGGLSTGLADPTGIFVFRNEREPVARDVLQRTDIAGPQRIIYVLNLTEPNGVFEARDFQIRDGDTIYVTEAPFVQWSKALNAFIGTLRSAESVSNATSGS